jgi:NAD-dependent deacetylase
MSETSENLGTADVQNTMDDLGTSARNRLAALSMTGPCTGPTSVSSCYLTSHVGRKYLRKPMLGTKSDAPREKLEASHRNRCIADTAPAATRPAKATEKAVLRRLVRPGYGHGTACFSGDEPKAGDNADGDEDHPDQPEPKGHVALPAQTGWPPSLACRLGDVTVGEASLPRPATVGRHRRDTGSVEFRDAVDQARTIVTGSRRIVVLTGAGISTESGIPDFRGPDGVWTKNPEAEKLSTLQAYVADPAVRRRSWQGRLDSPVWTAEPNSGHRALVALEQRGVLDTLVTQNIDGLHQAAGNDPDRVVEIHGTMRFVSCLTCGARTPMPQLLDRVRAGEEDPSCTQTTSAGVCAGILKSATISFGQNLVVEDLVRSEEAARRCDLLLAVGSTLSVYPAAGLVPTAHRAGARVVIVNEQPTEYDGLADVVVRGPIGEVLPALVGP